MKKFGKYQINDCGNHLIIETESFSLFIYKSMLTNEARVILVNAESEQDINAFLLAYARGLREIEETVNYLTMI